jgi:type VI secretion system protein ImpH
MTKLIEPGSPGQTSASSSNRANVPGVLDDLAERPYRFNFFQAVRLLMRIARRGADDATSNPVGQDYAPLSEVVRFRATPTHSFPQAEIVSFVPGITEREPGGPAPPEMAVSFLGLTGPIGALPQHYTQALIDRNRLKDHTLQNFFDLFNHRTISLFYRAWEKHHVPALLERAQSERREDPYTRGLYCLVGLGTPALRRRLDIADELLVYYSGLFAHSPKNAVSLERMLAEFFSVPVSIRQFQGQWLRLELPEQSAMPNLQQFTGQNCQLGVTAIAGERVWSVESKFRIRVGPLSYKAFQSLMPGSQMLTQLGQAARTYAGPEFDFDVQLILRREEVPPCQLGAMNGQAPRLGWNTWACSIIQTADADEPVFVADGRPSR